MKVFNKDKELKKMNLKQNKNKYIKYITLGISCLIMVIGIMYFTFAYYDTRTVYTAIDGKIHYEISTTIDKIYQGDTEVSEIPAKNTGWMFTKAECTNGVTTHWDYTNWKLDVTHTNQRTKCKLYFKEAYYNILSGDLDQIGSVIKIGEEEFYVIGQQDDTHIKLLSKWNLNVGDNANGTATNMQDPDAKGYVSASTQGYYEGMEKYGNVAFSTTNYWDDGSALKPLYGDNYPAQVYTNTKENDVYLNNIAQYIDNYVTYLNTQRVNVTGRLITQEELVSLGCNATTKYCDENHSGTAPSWVYQTSYWAGTARDNNNIWYVGSYGGFNGNIYNDDFYFGVRPVIILEM